MIAELGASSIKDMGKVMAAMKERYAGQMDFQSQRGYQGRPDREIARIAAS